MGHSHFNTLPELLKHQVLEHPHSPALWDLRRPPLTFEEMQRHIAELRHQARNAGLNAGKTVAILLKQPSDMALWIAALSAGLTCIPLPDAMSSVQIKQVFQVAEPDALIHDHPRTALIEQAAGELSIPVLHLEHCHGQQWRYHLKGATNRPPSAVWPAPTPSDFALILMTSGSTQSPKLVPVTHQAICTTIKASAEMLALKPNCNYLNVMPLNHVHGLVSGVFLPWSAGQCSVSPGNFDGRMFFDWLAASRPDWFSTSPAIYSEILRRARVLKKPLDDTPLRFVRCGSATLSPSLAAQISEAFRVPLLEAYGMSETLQITGVPYGQSRPGSVGKSLTLDIGIFDANGQRCPPGQSGEIRLKGPSVFPYYLGEAKPESVFVDGWFRTGDLGQLDSEGYLFLTGRRKEMINRGGENIAPAEIEAYLLDHPAVQQCVAFAESHPTLGEDIGVAIVPQPDVTVDTETIRQYAASRLPSHKLPASIYFFQRFPKTGSGKVKRREVVAMAEAKARSQQPETPTAGQLESWLRKQIEQILQVMPVYSDSDFFALGGSSLNTMELLQAIEDRWGIMLHLPVLLENRTARKIVQSLSQTYPKELGTASEQPPPQPPSPETTGAADHQSFIKTLPAFNGFDPPTEEQHQVSPVFILSAPRCGSTLLRVMLAGHPSLFSPPELRLLQYRDIPEWMEAHSGTFIFFREGLLQALMNALDLTLPEAKEWLHQATRDKASVAHVYHQLQLAVGGRRIVDKSPLYSLYPGLLDSLSNRFSRPSFILLKRNPIEMKRSFVEAHMEQLWMHPNSQPPERLAESIWYRCYANIDRHFRQSAASRCLWLSFEELVTQPDRVARRICNFLNLEFHPDMLEPYGNRATRMTDSLQSISAMIGDRKFLQHHAINEERAGTGLALPNTRPLGDQARELAKKLGYGSGLVGSVSMGPLSEQALLNQQLQLIQNWPGRCDPETPYLHGENLSGCAPPLFWCFQSDIEFNAMARCLDKGQPLYALRSSARLCVRFRVIIHSTELRILPQQFHYTL